MEQSFINLWIRSSSILKPLTCWRVDIVGKDYKIFLLWAANVYSEQKSVQLSPEDACSVRQLNTLGFILVNSRHAYSVTSFRIVCVYVILIAVAITQFINRIFENIGRRSIFFRAVKCKINHRASQQPRTGSKVMVVVNMHMNHCVLIVSCHCRMLLTILHCTMYTKWLWIVKDAEQPAAILLAVTCNHRADARWINHQQAAKYQRQNVPANVQAVHIQAVASTC